MLTSKGHVDKKRRVDTKRHVDEKRCVDKKRHVNEKRDVDEIRRRLTMLDGMQEEGRRVGDIVDKNIAIVAELGRADGFAPMDLFHKRSQSATVNENDGVLCHC